MPKFNKPLIVRVEEKTRSGRGLYTVMEPFEYCINEKEKIIIKKGFLTDFTSVPRGANVIISPSGLHVKAAVIHDALYRKGKYYESYPYNRKESDNILLSAMGILNVPVWKKLLIYYSVRIFGWFNWKEEK